jgi:hypothetical protein
MKSFQDFWMGETERRLMDEWTWWALGMAPKWQMADGAKGATHQRRMAESK